MNPFEDQRRFMQACGQTTYNANDQQAGMYADLITEEFDEWWAAQPGSPDDADACIDIMVVLIGYMFSRGWPAEELWKEVVRSNMSKVGPDGFVRRREDGKILKPENFSPPDIARILAEASCK